MKAGKIFAKGLRKLYRITHPNVVHNHVTIPDEAINETIVRLINDNKPFCIARLGTVDFNAMQYGFLCHESYWKRLKSFIQGFTTSYEPTAELAKGALDTLCFNSGFFPYDYTLMDKFYSQTINDFKLIDILGVMPWNKEDLFVDSYSKEVEYCNFARLEPYDYNKPWTRALKGKKVLIIHPFADSIEKQYARRELLWENKDVLPEFELKTIKAVQSVAGEKVPFDTWFDALHHMERQMDAIDYDIAILGCGAYGFPLAAHAKRSGKQVIQLGGATQILFGIKGKRWDELPEVNKFYNEYWVYPSKAETPKNAKKVEGGCFW